jgi:NAD(P)-dependent dehydrogenase (short-subunit alcohol dehydrogenase family)
MAEHCGAVLVTGASTGIGRAAALRLAEAGFHVFAGVRRPADGTALVEEHPRVEPVQLDVTDEAQVAAVAAHVSASTAGELAGLVNNAGVYAAAPLELMPAEDTRRIFEVNVLGLIAITRACLPMLRAAGGRIVNVSSVSGRLALPGVSSYAASKFAVEALSDALRVEMRPFGVAVALVEPGGVRTDIWGKARETDARYRAEADAETMALYRPLVEALEEVNARRHAAAPEDIARVIVEALTTRQPRSRYLVGLDARLIARLEHLPDGLRDALVARQLWQRREG